MNTKTLLAQYTPLVHKIAVGFQRKLPRNVLREDLIAAGMVGLWGAIQKHDEKHENFEAYAYIRIRGSILDELRAQDWLPRHAHSRAAAEAVLGAYVSSPCPAVVRFDDVSEFEQNRMLQDAATSNEGRAIANQALATLLKAVDTLPERERLIVARHYFEGVKFKTLADELGVSEPRISQLHSRAMQRLRENASHLSAAL